MHLLTRAEVCRRLAVEEAFLLELESAGLVVVHDHADAGGAYAFESLERIRVCHTLRAELGVNWAGVEVALTLLDRLHGQQARMDALVAWIRESRAGP